MLEDADETVLMEMAARTLGKLVKSGAARTSDIVDKEVRQGVRRALERGNGLRGIHRGERGRDGS